MSLSVAAILDKGENILASAVGWLPSLVAIMSFGPDVNDGNACPLLMLLSPNKLTPDNDGEPPSNDISLLLLRAKLPLNRLLTNEIVLSPALNPEAV